MFTLDVEKSHQFPGNSLLARLYSTRRYYAGFWGTKDMNDLSLSGTLHALISIYMGRLAYNSGMIILGLVSHFMIAFDTFSIEKN